MIQIGITGHQKLQDDSLWSWVSEEIANILKPYKRFAGLSSLAVGADQAFAKVVIEQGGDLIGIIPFPEYLDVYEEKDRPQYLRLLKEASVKIILPKEGTQEESYFLAGRIIAESVDILVAVWDGKGARGLGGTGDVVKYAHNLGKTVYHISPTNVEVKKL